MSCATSEKELFRPKPGWIEIDHSSDNVSYSPEIDPIITDYFELQQDPNDERNVWLSPKEDVHYLGEMTYDEESEGSNSFRYIHRLLLPDGQYANLIYEDAALQGHGDRQGVNRVVRMEFDPQRSFRLVNSLGKQAIR